MRHNLSSDFSTQNLDFARDPEFPSNAFIAVFRFPVTTTFSPDCNNTGKKYFCMLQNKIYSGLSLIHPIFASFDNCYRNLDTLKEPTLDKVYFRE